jgi:hypothetical protein
VWIDEYKPSQIDDRNLESLHTYIRKATRKDSISKGNKDMSVTKYPLQAPIVLSGEERLKGSAERRRQIHVTFQESTTHSVEYSKRFAEVVGESWEDAEGDIHYEEGCSLEEHAKAYYRYVLDVDEEDFKDTWRESKEQVREILAKRNLQVENLDRTKITMVRQGIRLFRHFASKYDADLEITEDEIEDAIVHLAETTTETTREDHMDVFIRLLGLADTDGSTRHANTFGDGPEEVHISLDEAYADVRKYMRENDVGGAYEVLQSPEDYRERLRDMADADDSYVVDTSKVDSELNRCIALDAEKVAEEIYNGEMEEVEGRF